ncbi:MAG: hypothetical protein LBE80_07320 [Deltaproteobacteria bacterium]|jgi:glycine betaine/choline ABC-type transport system substrate-binding protein|nr:hypothetical protein [Deltaproteobacteria bacterium]
MNNPQTFEKLLNALTELDYTSKLKLIHFLTEQVRKEEETLNKQNMPGTNLIGNALTEEEIATYVDYIGTRLLKSRPKKLKQLLNFIRSMFQFKGGISDHDVLEIINKLNQKSLITIDGNNVSYSGAENTA